MNRFDTVIVSDLHLGARNSRTAQIRQFLQWVKTDRLILAGDVFDAPGFSGLDADSANVIEVIRAISHNHELVWLKGNHDPVNVRWLGWDTTSCDELIIDVGGRLYCVCHGHRWDKSLDLPRWIISGADGIYHLAQRLDPSHRLARRLKRGCKRFCRSIRMLQEAAVSAARQRDLGGIILGHSHVAHDIFVNGVHYLNAGCWTERPSAFVGIRDGKAHGYYWQSATLPPQRLPVQTDDRPSLPAADLDLPRMPEAA